MQEQFDTNRLLWDSLKANRFVLEAFWSDRCTRCVPYVGDWSSRVDGGGFQWIHVSILLAFHATARADVAEFRCIMMPA